MNILLPVSFFTKEWKHRTFVKNQWVYHSPAPKTTKPTQTNFGASWFATHRTNPSYLWANLCTNGPAGSTLRRKHTANATPSPISSCIIGPYTSRTRNWRNKVGNKITPQTKSTTPFQQAALWYLKVIKNQDCYHSYHLDAQRNWKRHGSVDSGNHRKTRNTTG